MVVLVIVVAAVADVASCCSLHDDGGRKYSRIIWGAITV